MTHGKTKKGKRARSSRRDQGGRFVAFVVGLTVGVTLAFRQLTGTDGGPLARDIVSQAIREASRQATSRRVRQAKRRRAEGLGDTTTARTAVARVRQALAKYRGAEGLGDATTTRRGGTSRTGTARTRRRNGRAAT